MAVTEASWFRPNPPPEALAFWKAAYPEMGSVTENIQKTEKHGYGLVDHFPLPDASWWEHYYDPLAERIDMLRKK